MNNKKNIFHNSLLLLIGIGIWIIVFQNMGLIPIVQKVQLEGGYVSDITQEVKIKGEVKVDSTVNINLHSINGQQDVFFNNPDRGHHDKYYRLPVSFQ